MYDWLVKNIYIPPARKCGKSQLQLALYQELLKGDQSTMDFKSWLSDKHIKPFAPPTIAFNPESEKVEQINIPEPEYTPPKEEWVWIKGYKGTDANMRCRDYQYTLGEQFDMAEGMRVQICDSGFHFCKNLRNVFKFYEVGNGNRFFEVEALVRKSDLDNPNTFTLSTYNPYSMYNSYQCRPSSEDKYTSKSIRFIRELTADEVFAEYPGHHKIRNWTTEQKELAMKTSISKVFEEARVAGLTSLGYSEPFARYIANDDQKYKIAMAVGSQPQVSMDVKVMAIFCKN